MVEVAALTLASICLDVQIGVCMYLHPSDILALRKTCKAFQLSTRKRVVWVAALHRVCLDNTLFLPSFPISDMSDLELEKAAIAPTRWIELCGAFEKQYLNDLGATLRPRETRIINDSLVTPDIASKFFIVPGGRYLVVSSYHGISVLDLSCTSSTESGDCTLIASDGQKKSYRTFIVQATTDGMGLIIFSSELCRDCSIYENYPQTETPRLIQIAHLDVFSSTESPSAYLLPDTVIWCDVYADYLVFRVWDYRLNHSISFSVNCDTHLGALGVMATKTAVIVLRKKSVLIWAIPPLSPRPPDFSDYDATNMPMAPLFTIPFPNSIGLNSERIQWKTISSWYSGSSQPLYFDALCQGKLHRFQIVLKPDLTTASIRVINTSEPTPHNFDYVFFQDYRICEDALVSCWISNSYHLNFGTRSCGVYTGLTSTRFANVISRGGPTAKMLLPDIGRHGNYNLYLCPASGRFVLVDSGRRLAVLDCL